MEVTAPWFDVEFKYTVSLRFLGLDCKAFMISPQTILFSIAGKSRLLNDPSTQRMNASGTYIGKREFHWHNFFDLDKLVLQGLYFVFFFSLAIHVCFASVFRFELNILYQWIKKPHMSHFKGGK